MAKSRTGASKSPFSNEHVYGDLLLLSNFTNGGGNVNLRVYMWVGSGGSDGPLDFLGTSTDAAVNSADYPVPVYPNWSYTPKSGTGYVTGSFYEGKIDLGGLTGGICFSSFLLETRNSQSVNASLQDFSGGSFGLKPLPPVTVSDSRCGAGIVNLTASAPAGMTIKWYNNEDLAPIHQVATGTSYSPNLTVTTTYWVTVTNATNCTSDPSTVVGTIYPTPSASAVATNPLCYGGTGSINLTVTGGTPPYTFLWSNGAVIEDPSGLAAGTYNVTVTDAHQCTTTASATISIPSDIALSLNKTDVLCFGSSDGTVTATFSGGTPPYMAKIDGGSYAAATSPKTFTGLAAGSHMVWVKDANNCEKSASITVGTPTDVILNLEKTNVLCNGNDDGTITATFSGGTPPYMAKVDAEAYAAATSPKTFTGMTPGVHTVWVKDANNCEKSASVEILEPDELTCTIVLDVQPTYGHYNGVATVYPVGGTPPYIYAWTNGETTQTAIHLGAGTATVYITDANECQTFCALFIETNEPEGFCTYTQGFYGSQKGTACDMSESIRGDIFVANLLAQGDLTIGSVVKNNYITFKAGDAARIASILPGGSGFGVLSGACVPSANWNCIKPYLTKQGKLNNGLLAQTLTLGLNLRINDGLDGMELQSEGWLTTQKRMYCEEGSPLVAMVCDPVYQWDDVLQANVLVGYTMKVDPYWYGKLPEGVLCYMYQNGYEMTVGGLYALANDALGQVVTFPANVTCGDITYTVGLSNISSAVDLINNAFDECRAFVGYLDEKFECPEVMAPLAIAKSATLIQGNLEASDLKVYPNPFSNKVTFEFVAAQDGHAVLEISNLLGQKIATLLDKNVQKGVLNKVEYDAAGIVPGMMLYQLRLDDKIQIGKLIYNP